MSLRVLVLVVTSALLAGLSSAQAQLPPVPPGWQIERAVLLSRHGVRSPLQTNEELDRYAATPWPVWPVAPGYLTQHGAELMRLMGAYYRVIFGGGGLVRSDDCPPTGTVAAWADIAQRTQLSAASLLVGMYPRCTNLVARHQSDLSVPDPLFHPRPSPSCPIDASSNKAAILERIGGNFSSVLREYGPQLSAMQAVLCPAGAASGGARCGRQAVPSALDVSETGRATIKGPFGLGSTAAEIFLMEAAEGLPSSQVAWGRLSSDAELTRLLSIHRLNFDLTQKTVPIARQQGSNMLTQIVATLQDGHKFPGQPSSAQPVRLAFLVGHDTNIAHIESLLRLTWHLEGFQPNEASPGGALAFELFREVSTGRYYVRLAYLAQSLPQMRGSTQLSLNDPPGMVAVDLPGCEANAKERACPIERFVEIAKVAIEPGCVTIKP